MIKKNLKEAGVFEGKVPSYERTHISVVGKTTSLGINRSIIKFEDIHNFVRNVQDIKLPK
jgi:hypothetical protein